MARGFAAFLFRGNVVDLAVAVVIGAAAGSVITAFVKDIFAPTMGAIFGRHESVAHAKWSLRGNELQYGDFLSNLLSFLIVAIVVYFLVIVPVQKLAANEKLVPLDRDDRKCPECLSDIPRKARRCAFCTTAVDPLA
ncbi:MAG: large conductance mechanosensitive channel protein MscL [Candidatus Meridianibacter frigidus]|nr:MAG: large conductance mechanosensitive channel protein MscL [Candidatus Eremiobacteraeota bacterium]